VTVPVYFFSLEKNSRELRDADSRTLTYSEVIAGATSFLVRRSFPKKGLPNALTAVKVHFGEPGNFTFIPPHFIAPVIGALEAARLRPFLTDTNVIYESARSDAVGHAAAAREHGFAAPGIGAPVIIADGLVGESFVEVEIGGKWFKRVKIAGAVASAGSLVVVSHAKAHALMGFSGAIKNLGMGCASKAGKQEQHSGRFVIDLSACARCGRCLAACGSGAISEDFEIDPTLCNGCGQCYAECADRAIHGSTGGDDETDVFPEKVCEYALGAVKGKMVVCVSFLINIVPYCDCNARADLPIVPDIGILFSSDPVAIDQAAFDLINRAQPVKGSVLARKPRRRDHFSALFPEAHPAKQMRYGKRIGLGTNRYSLVDVRECFPRAEKKH
jgi:uncharacterized Fe-S center protein